jgi:hypothetical protein
MKLVHARGKFKAAMPIASLAAATTLGDPRSG